MTDRIKPTYNPEDETFIDEQDLVENGLTIITDLAEHEQGEDEDPCEPHFGFSPEQVEAMLDRAGYDPKRIPEDLREIALEIVWCWDKHIGDEDLAFVVDQDPKTVRAAVRALHLATHNKAGDQ